VLVWINGPCGVGKTVTGAELSRRFDHGHFGEMIGGLRGDGVDVHHFALLAEPATVARRLRARSLGREPRTQPWETEVLDGWLEQLRRVGGAGDRAVHRRPGAFLAAPVRHNRAPHPLGRLTPTPWGLNAA
jgi:hypothetical protein